MHDDGTSTWRLHGPGAWALDAALAAVLFAAVTVALSLWEQPGWRPLDAAGYMWTALIWLPLAGRRAAPMTALLVSTIAFFCYLLDGYTPGLISWGPVLAFYSVAAAKPARDTAAGALLAGAVLLIGGLQVPYFGVTAAVAQAVAVLVAAWILGGLARQLSHRNRQLAEANRRLAEASLRLEQEQLRHTEQAITRERLRISRELHDIVAHHVTVISLQAGVADYVLDSDPATARTAVNTIADTSRETLEELRRVLHLLRGSDAVEDATEPAEAPAGQLAADGAAERVLGVAQLAPLIERVRLAGVDADLHVQGDVEELPPGLQLTAYRVVQEALTNVIKHAGPCRAVVTVCRRSGALTVSVANDAPERPVEPRPHGEGGHGLIGMRERARLYGGTLTTNPRPEGGFAVNLTIPDP
ncbi:sensor histidine kinase [Nonomuraea thailandensis]